VVGYVGVVTAGCDHGVVADGRGGWDADLLAESAGRAVALHVAVQGNVDSVGVVAAGEPGTVACSCEPGGPLSGSIVRAGFSTTVNGLEANIFPLHIALTLCGPVAASTGTVKSAVGVLLSTFTGGLLSHSSVIGSERHSADAVSVAENVVPGAP